MWLERALLGRLLPGYVEDPAAALLLASVRLGVGPVVLFDPDWYRARYRVPLDRPALSHYLELGAGRNHDPHPLFSVAHYRRSAPEASGNALWHFLAIGGPAGLDCHPCFASRWYLHTYPDVGEAGMVPLLHFLQWGAREGREPNPLFSVPHYLRQTDDPAARRNPLLHFVLGGEAAGLTPHPTFRPAPVRRAFTPGRAAGPLGTYLSVIGAEQPSRAAALAAPQPELPLLPPPLPRTDRPEGEAAEIGTDLLQRLGLLEDGAGEYGVGKLESIAATPELAGELASALARQNGHGLHTLLAGTGLLPRRLPQAPSADPAADVAGRYAALQFAAATRFRLDPARAGAAPRGPLISILLPVYRTPLHLLERAILSVLCQTYADWELCVVDDGSDQPGLAAALHRFAKADPRIKLEIAERNGGISAASNRALALATGNHAGLLDHDDMLTGDALEHVARALAARPDADLLYSDECTIDLDDVPERLFPKPDWSPALLTSFMYTSHFSVYRTGLVRELGGFRSAFDLSQDYDLALRVAERDPAVVHIREVLYGWRTAPGSAASGEKPEARLSNVAALQEAVDRRGWAGRAVGLLMSNRIERTVSPPPLVSIVVPSDDPRHIAETVMSIVAHTRYERREIVVVAGDAAIAECAGVLAAGCVRFVPFNAAFNFSAKCNAGAAAAKGEVLLFLNDDVRVLSPDWIEAMLEALTLPGVGAVAPKLLYADNTIQHAGMVTGTRRLVATAFHCFPHATSSHFNMAQSLREVSLLSGACLAVHSRLFRDVGGFDAVHMPITHSDVDLCLRLREAGHRCLYTPHAELTHLGHQALGAAEQQTAFRQDKADIHLLRRWGKQLEDDPYFPPGMRELLLWGDHRPFRYHAADRRPEGARGDALLVSHDLSRSGAPKIVFDMARALLGAGRQVVVMAAEDGPFRARLLLLGADVIIEPDALFAGPGLVAFARNFDLVVCNTVLCWRLPPALGLFTRVFLYAHETELAASMGAAEPEFAPALAGAHGVWAGSDRSAAALRRLGVEPVVLEYGVEAPELPPVDVRGRDVIIATLATMEPRKGQDLAVKAFAYLPPELRRRCRLKLEGRPHDLPFTEAIKEIARPEPRIEIGGELDLENYRLALAAADIVLCPSRDDTLPIVSLDALAAGKVLVMSQEVGTSAYLEDGVSGFVLRHNHPEEIARTLTRVIAERARWPEIAAAAQRVFREHFSQARFAERLLGLVGDRAVSVEDAAD